MIAQASQQQERTAYFFNLLGSTSESGVDWQSVVMETNSDYGEKFTKADIKAQYFSCTFVYV